MTDLSTPPVCPQCRYTNPSGALFCQNCGGSLTAARLSVPAAPTPWSPAPIPPPYGSTNYASLFGQGDRREKIDRTKTGLLLLAIGSLVGVIPIIGLLGGIIAIIGAIFVIVGRKPFAKPHSEYVLWSVGLYVFGFVVLIISTVGFTIALYQAARIGGASGLADALASNFDNLLVGLFIGGAVSGIGTVLFTYALQKPVGRVLLWAAYVGSLAIGVYVMSVIGSQVSAAAQEAFSNGTFNRAPLDALQTRLANLRLLTTPPALIYAFTYYLAWSRISKGEIPAPLSPPSTLASPIP